MTTEREYTSDREAYEYFVGQVSPQEFVKPFGVVNAISRAIDHFLKNWSHPEPVPQWLETALFRYIEDCLDGVLITRHQFDFDNLTDEEQESALRNLLRQMNSRQLWKAYDIAHQFVTADNAERKKEADYETN